MPYFADEALKDIELTITEPAKNQIKIVAYIGDLYLGEKTFIGGSVKAAKKNVISHIKYNGSLH